MQAGIGYNMRGYFGIGIYKPSHTCNVGTLFRSAHSFGASFIYTIGRKYSRQAGDTSCAYRHVPLYSYNSLEHFLSEQPKDCKLVLVETFPNAIPIKNFIHPERAIYLLGNEVKGLPQELQHNTTVVLPGRFCLNVATAGSIVMYDRYIK